MRPPALGSSTGWTAALGLLLAGTWLLWALPGSPGLSPDSLKYLLLARSLADGQGFSLLGAPATHYPPGYPALLALVGAGGPPWLERTRALHAALFALNAALAVLTAGRLGRGSPWSAPLALLLWLASPRLVSLHEMAWSEPAFIGFMLGAGLLLSSRQAGAGRGALLGAAACLSAALLTRYAGLSLLPPLSLAVLLWQRRPLRARIGDSAILGVIGFGPLAVWLIRNLAVSESATNRSLAFHPLGAGHVEQLAAAGSELWGTSVLALAALTVLLTVVGRTTSDVARGKWGRQDASASSALLGATVFTWLSYVAFLGLAISLFDADVPLDTRLLAPAHALAIPLVAAFPWQLQHAGRGRAARALLVTFCALGVASLPVALREAARIGAEGEGFDSPLWRDSPTLAALRSLDPRTTVFTNGPEIVAFSAHANAVDVPAWGSTSSLRDRPEYARELRELCTALERGAVLAYLDNIAWRWQVPTESELRAACPVKVARRFADGTVYVAASSGAASPFPARQP